MTPSKPAVVPKPVVKPKWYELDYLVPYRDLLLLFGFMLLIYGIFLIYRPASLIIAGVGFIAASYFMASK